MTDFATDKSEVSSHTLSRSRAQISFLSEALFWDADGLAASPWSPRIPFLGWLVENLGPGSVVELGTGRGDSFRALCLAVGRFSGGGKCLGIDDEDASTPTVVGRVPPGAGELQEFCQARGADWASVVRMSSDEASTAFGDESIDLLHATSQTLGGRTDLTMWFPKMRPGGVILLTGPTEDRPLSTPPKQWREVFESFSCAELTLFGPVGIAQAPIDGRAPIVEALRSTEPHVGALFRLLGERMQFRGLLGSEPTTPRGISQYIDRLLEDHLREVQRIQAIHKLEVEMTEKRLAAADDRASQQAQKVNELERENNLLLAKLARYSAIHAHEIDAAETDFKHRIDELRRIYEIDRDNLRGHVDYLNAELTAIRATSSWRITRPLRTVRRMLLRIKSLGSSR